MRALESDDADGVARLVETHGAAAVRNDADPAQLTSLHWAASSGALSCVELLLSAAVQADPRAARSNDFTPLHAAAMNGHTRVVAVLADAGADVNAQTVPQRYAPLHSAAFAGHVDTIEVLLAHGADKTLKNYRGETPADTARRTGETESARLLDAYDRDDEGQ